MAIYPIFIAVGLPQNCKQNFIFITVDCRTMSPKSRQNLARILPKSRQGCTTISPKSRQGCTTISPKSRQVALRSRQNLAKILPKSRHSCSTMSLRLAELQYDLATVAVGWMSPRLAELQYDLATVVLRCSQDSQDCYTISPQLHNDVPKTRRIAIRYRHS